MRANATQQSDWELMTEDDFDHLEIVKQLAHATTDITQGLDDMYQMATYLLETYQRGHNVNKFNGRQLPKELGDLIVYTMQGRIKILAKGIATFEQDLSSGGTLFLLLVKCIILSLAQRNRVEKELRERTIRKSGVNYKE